MKLIVITLIIISGLLAVGLSSYSEEAPATAHDKALSFSDKSLSKINNKAVDLNGLLDKQTQRYLNRLAKQEKQLI